jgi:hypothetical protein
MKLGRLTLALAAAGVAANLFLKKRADGAVRHPDFVDTEDSGYAGSDPTLDASGAGVGVPTEMAGGTGIPGLDLESPNPAERLQAGGETALAEAVGRTSDALFDSNSQPGPYPKTPGLPDLTRGA